MSSEARAIKSDVSVHNSTLRKSLRVTVITITSRLKFTLVVFFWQFVSLAEFKCCNDTDTTTRNGTWNKEKLAVEK